MSPVQPGVYAFRSAAAPALYLDQHHFTPDLVHTWTLNGKENQKWAVQKVEGEDAFVLHNIEFRHWAIVKSDAAGANLNTTPNKAEASKWTFEQKDDGIVVKLVGTDLVVDLDGGKQEPGTSIHLYPYHNAKWQAWLLDPQGSNADFGVDGEYKA